MNQIPHSHPLDKLISDDRLFLLEAILPFVEGPMRMPLVIYLKMMELQQIMRVINNQSYIRQCDFNRDLHNQNDILTSLAQCGFPDIADQMKNMQQAMNMMQVMNAMNQMGTPESPPDSSFQNNVTEPVQKDIPPYDEPRKDSVFPDFQSIFQAYDQTVQAEPNNTSISTDTEYTNNNPSIQGNRPDEKIHDFSTHENTKNTSTTDQSSSQHSDNSMDHIMQLLQEYDTNTRSAT